MASESEDINDLASSISLFVDNFQDESNIPGMFADIVNAALADVAWDQIAEQYEEFIGKSPEEY